MARVALRKFDSLLSKMEDEGLIGEELSQQRSKNPDGLEFVLELMEMYCKLVQENIDLVNKHLEKADFHEVTECVHLIKGYSMACGAKRVFSACLAYRQAYDQKDIERCKDMVNMVKHEFDNVRVRFEHSIKFSQEAFPNIGKPN